VVAVKEAMTPRFAQGDRVRISVRYHWACGAVGTIHVPPPFLDETVGSPPNSVFGGNVWREVAQTDGTHLHYAVRFDEPQTDVDGDGPFAAAEVDGEYLEAI